jgi:hypothetical protein
MIIVRIFLLQDNILVVGIGLLGSVESDEFS